jgi:hypothetical protein
MPGRREASERASRRAPLARSRGGSATVLGEAWRRSRCSLAVTYSPFAVSSSCPARDTRSCSRSRSSDDGDGRARAGSPRPCNGSLQRLKHNIYDARAHLVGRGGRTHGLLHGKPCMTTLETQHAVGLTPIRCVRRCAGALPLALCRSPRAIIAKPDSRPSTGISLRVGVRCGAGLGGRDRWGESRTNQRQHQQPARHDVTVCQLGGNC